MIHFEDAGALPDSEDTQQRVTVVGRLSDKELWVYAIFTPEAVARFEDDEDMPSIYSIRGGVINLVLYEVVASEPLAVVVHDFKFIGSEGCTTFGAPINCNHHPPIQLHLQQKAAAAAVLQPDRDGEIDLTDGVEAEWEPSQENSEALGAEVMNLLSHIHDDSAVAAVAVMPGGAAAVCCVVGAGAHQRATSSHPPVPAGSSAGGYRSSIITGPQQHALQAASAWYVPGGGAVLLNVPPVVSLEDEPPTTADDGLQPTPPTLAHPTPTARTHSRTHIITATAPVTEQASPLLLGSPELSSSAATHQSTESTGKRKRSPLDSGSVVKGQHIINFNTPYHQSATQLQLAHRESDEPPLGQLLLHELSATFPPSLPGASKRSPSTNSDRVALKPRSSKSRADLVVWIGLYFNQS
jgi:hypothetical protein